MITPEKLQGIIQKYETIEAQLGDPAVVQDINRLRELGKEHARLREIVAVARDYEKAVAAHAD